MDDVGKIITRLQDLGYTTSDTDSNIIKVLLSDVREYILNYCNLDDMPNKLINTYYNIVCGKFLKQKLANGTLQGITGLQEGNISSISEGDVSISYNKDNSAIAQLNTVIAVLTDESMLKKFRKLRW